jgi:hypothetical protein
MKNYIRGTKQNEKTNKIISEFISIPINIHTIDEIQ